jgi:hypothetical protein
MSTSSWLRCCAAIWLVSVVVMAQDTAVKAVPAFARKYQTSCQTCHTVFPKLNAFGVAFRLRGYRMPGETEDMVKEKPVSLGAPAYKRLWPQAVWPSEISPTVPLAVNIQMADVNTSALNEDGSVSTVHNDLQFPQELTIFGTGTLGDHLSYFSELAIGQHPDGSAEIEIEHAHLAFDSPFGPEDAFHFRIGKIMPNVVDGFHEMQIATDAGIDSLFGYKPIGIHGGTEVSEGMGGMSLPMHAAGIEAYGMIQHRTLWVAGIANGLRSTDPDAERFDGNNAKDVYARLDYKFGGMGFDGDTGGAPVPTKNWRDNSLRVGAFTYRGDGSGIGFPAMAMDLEAPPTIVDRHFLRTGIFASLYYQDLNVFGAYLHGTDALQLTDAESGAVLTEIQPTYHAWFTQADYVIYPWLDASARYETVTPGDASVPSLRTGVFTLNALIRANVKALLEYQRDLREGANHSLNLIVRFAF